MAIDYTQMTNPFTGKPFASQQEGETWAAGESSKASAAGRDSGAAAADAAFAGYHNTGYDFGGKSNSTIYTDPNNGRIYFGGTGSGLNGGANFTTRGKSGGDTYYAAGADGYIDPVSGKIVYGAGSAPTFSYSAPPFGYQGSTESLHMPGEGDGTQKAYYYNQDYGLGKGFEGIIPLLYNATGQPTKFYSGSGSGGGQMFDNIEDAKAARDAYKVWYDGQHPAGTAGTQIAPGASVATATGTPGATTPSKPGELYNPGSGENFFDSTKGFYTQPTQARKQWDATSGQPSAAEQNWNGLSGQFNAPSDQESLWANYKDAFADPSSLADFYGRQQQQAQVSLDRRASSAGVGDSSAAAKATGNLGALFADREMAGREAFANTGMGLAGASDAGRTGRASTLSGLAGAKDTADINRFNMAVNVDAGEQALTTDGQVAANSAEQMAINRATGATSSALAIGNDIGTLTAAGMKDIYTQTYLDNLNELGFQIQQKNMTFDQAMKKATELAATMGVVNTSALNYLIAQKLTAPTPSSTPASAGQSYTTQTVNY